ncbi:MAG: hypothetical protein GY862_24530 [Gammaproteobacteria bacterium]|nr:hypothetical protein [Gammaproteobacteria bacterium]
MNWICANNLSRAETCLINDARLKVMGFGAGKTMPKTAIGARLYPSYKENRGALRGTSRLCAPRCIPFIFPGLPDARQRGAPNAGFRAERRNQEKCALICNIPVCMYGFPDSAAVLTGLEQTFLSHSFRNNNTAKQLLQDS